MPGADRDWRESDGWEPLPLHVPAEAPSDRRQRDDVERDEHEGDRPPGSYVFVIDLA